MAFQPKANEIPQTNFSKIKIGGIFTASDGETYTKRTELTFDDSYGLEHYIDPMFDRKINQPVSNKPTVDTSAKIVAGTPTNELLGTDAPKKAKKTKTTTKKGK